MAWYKYSSKVIAPGFELKSDNGEPLSVCETAKWSVNGGRFIHQFDHVDADTGYEHFRFLETTTDLADGMPIVSFEVDETIHEHLQSDRFKGVSPVIEVQEVNEKAKKFTKYRIDGISFQFEAKPACPDSFCPTEYKGGDTVDKDEEIVEEQDAEETEETETEPKKVVKQKVVKKVKAPAAEAVEQALESTSGNTTTTAEYVARLIRQNEDLEKRIKVFEDERAVREEKRREELLASIPEEHRDFAKKLEAEALENIASILNKQRDSAKAEKDAATIVESGAVETTDADNQKKTTEETKDKTVEDPEKKERDFFDKSGVFTVSQEKSGLFR